MRMEIQPQNLENKENLVLFLFQAGSNTPMCNSDWKGWPQAAAATVLLTGKVKEHHRFAHVFHASYWGNQNVPFQKMISVVLWTRLERGVCEKEMFFPLPGFFFLHSLLPCCGRLLHPPNLLSLKKFLTPTSLHLTQWGLSWPIIAGVIG